MKIKVFFTISLTVLFLISGCSNEEILPSDNLVPEKEKQEEINNGFMATVPPYEFEDGTRIDIDHSLKVFNWRSGDKIAVYYDDGSNSATASFTVQKGGSNTGIFKNPGFKLIPNHEYYAFYPFSEGATASKSTMNYWGQTQKENGSTEHLGAYNYMYTKTISDSNGTGIFTFQNYNAVLKFELRVPESGTFTSLTVQEENGNSLVYKCDFNSRTGAVNYFDYGYSYCYLLSFDCGITLSAGDVLDAYLAVPPEDMSKKKLKLELATGLGRIYTATVDGKSFFSGKAYQYNTSLTTDDYPTVTPEGLKTIDMGTSVLWANMNVGAESESDLGYTFAFGERKPKSYGGYSNKFRSTTGEVLKYPDDGHEILAPEDDAATVFWGKNWRMPTGAEIAELYMNVSSFSYSMSQGGMTIYAKNGQSLYFPFVENRNVYVRSSQNGNAYTLSAGDYHFYFGNYGVSPYQLVPVRAVYDAPIEKGYVDLGLPSGTLWANCNVGATHVGDMGDCFVWGDPRPKREDEFEYNSLTSKYIYEDENKKYLKYNWDKNLGQVDYLTTLQPSDDAATYNWGSEWRLPTPEEIQELIDACNWRTAIRKNTVGFLVTGPNGNQIYIPINYSDKIMSNSMSSVYYMSNTLNSENSNSCISMTCNGLSHFLEDYTMGLNPAYKIRSWCSRKTLSFARAVRVKKNDYQNGSGDHFLGDNDW